MSHETMRIICTLILSLSALSFAGCKFEWTNDLVPGEGRIEWEGKPLAAATISFIRADGNGPPATGMSDDKGVFRLGSVKSGDGLLPGEYLVTVSKSEILNTPTEKEMEAHFKKTGQNPEPEIRYVVPKAFSDRTTTPLKYTVSAKGGRNIVVRLSAETGSVEAAGNR